MRPIDGDALIAWIKDSQQMTSKMRNVICKIETMPIADRPPGEWLDSYGEHMPLTSYSAYCSLCGAWSEYLTEYCPHCGARMED